MHTIPTPFLSIQIANKVLAGGGFGGGNDQNQQGGGGFGSSGGIGGQSGGSGGESQLEQQGIQAGESFLRKEL